MASDECPPSCCSLKDFFIEKTRHGVLTGCWCCSWQLNFNAGLKAVVDRTPDTRLHQKGPVSDLISPHLSLSMLSCWSPPPAASSCCVLFCFLSPSPPALRVFLTRSAFCQAHSLPVPQISAVAMAGSMLYMLIHGAARHGACSAAVVSWLLLSWATSGPGSPCLFFLPLPGNGIHVPTHRRFISLARA